MAIRLLSSENITGNITVSGTGTFGGNVTAARGIFNSGNTNVVATFTSTDGTAGIALIDSGGNVELSASGNTFQVQPSGGTAALTVSSANSTFDGTVKIGNGSLTSPSTNANDLVIDKGAGVETGMTFASSVASSIRFGQFVNNSIGSIEYIHTGNHLRFITNGTERVRITGVGKVGIGTDSPDATLELYNISQTSDGDGSATETLSGQDSLLLQAAGGGVGKTTGSITWRAGSRRRAMITSVQENADGDYQGIAFYTKGTDGPGDMFESMRIAHSGNVGIGTDSPTSKLEVFGTSTAASNTASNAILDIHSTSTAHLLMGVAAVTPYGAWINTDSTAQPLVLMGTGGNVGIGTITPNTALQVNQAITVPLLVHRPSNTSFDPHGIGFSTRSDALNGGLGDVRSGIFSDYNGDLFLAAAQSSITTNPLASARLFIEGSNGNVGIGVINPETSRLLVRGSTNDSTSTIFQAANLGGATKYAVRADGDNKWYKGDNSQAMVLTTSGNLGIGINPTSKLTLPQEEENGFKIEFTGGSYSSGISTVDQAGSGLYIGANSYVNSSGLITYKDSALDSSGIYFDAWNGNNIEFYTALSGTPQQRMEITGGGAVVINGTTNLIGNLRVGGTALATSNLHVYAAIGNGSSLWSIGASATYAYTAHKQWTSFDGAYGTGVFYTIGVIEDSRSAIINVKTAAHSNATILVSRGYGPSNVARFQVLSSTKNPNGGYANITDVQISGGGKVDIKLVWSTGPNVAVEVTVYGNGFTIANTLQASTATVGGNYPENVLFSHFLASDAGSAMVSGQLRVAGNIVNPGTWGTTTGSAANMHVDSNGTFYRSTSSLKYKKDVRDYDKGLNEVMQLKPKYYKGKDDGDVQFAGLIAEDVHDLGLNEFVQYAEDDTPDALAYPNMIALLTKAIQDLKAEINELKTLIK